MFKTHFRQLLLLIVFCVSSLGFYVFHLRGRHVLNITKPDLNVKAIVSGCSPECDYNRNEVNLHGGETFQNQSLLNSSVSRLSMDFEVNLTEPMLSSYLQSYEKMFNSSMSGFPIYKKPPVGTVNSTPKTVLCTMYRKAYMGVLDKHTRPFREMGIGKYFKSPPLGKYSSCALVGSSVTIKGLKLGSEIDSHDAVFRFNLAPTDGFEKDVGKKTTIRIINNQFLENNEITKQWEQCEDMKRNVSFYIWKGCNSVYNGNLYQFYNCRRTYLQSYFKWTSLHPYNPVYFINPIALYRGWDVIQEYFNKIIVRQIPSSGFIGVQLVLTQCKEIHVYGIVPPKDVKDDMFCHYYDKQCTTKKQYLFHPNDGERHLLHLMNTGSDNDLKQKGRLTLKGYSPGICP